MTKTYPHITRRKLRCNKIRFKIKGTKDMPRLTVFKSNYAIYAQLIDDESKTTLVSISDKKATGKTKEARAGIAGKILAEEALKKNINTCKFDRNGYKYIGRVKAFANGAREGGL